jgi:YtkA-like
MDPSPTHADAGHDDDELMRGAIATIVLLLSAAGLLQADGGTVEFREIAGPFIITLFSASSPLHAGPADLSVLVESTQMRAAVLDASVSLTLRKPKGGEINTAATHMQATNKLLYAAQPTLSEAGNWHVLVSVSRRAEHAEAKGDIDVLPAPPAAFEYWPYFAVIPCLIALFVLNQWLKARSLSEVRPRHKS